MPRACISLKFESTSLCENDKTTWQLKYFKQSVKAKSIHTKIVILWVKTEYINPHPLETTPYSVALQHTGFIMLLHEHLPMEVFIITISRYNTFSLLRSQNEMNQKS